MFLICKILMMVLTSQGLNKTMNMHVVGSWWSIVSQQAFYTSFSKYEAPVGIFFLFIESYIATYP